MITKVKKSVSISTSLLEEFAPYKNRNLSEFIEKAMTYYLYELKKRERGQRDIEIINANAKRLNRETEENLKFQDFK